MNPKRHLGRFRAAKNDAKAKAERARTGFWLNVIGNEVDAANRRLDRLYGITPSASPETLAASIFKAVLGDRHP